jgi:hypothetical protein
MSMRSRWRRKQEIIEEETRENRTEEKVIEEDVMDNKFK